MKVEVVSKEYIRPSSPTPQILKNFKLSLLHQLALNYKSSFVFFFDSSADSHELKKSLSQTLSLMYPLAGRLKEDKITIECNDEGVEFIEAHVAENMSSLLQKYPDNVEIIRPLIPCDHSTGSYEPSPTGKPLAAIQLNRFSCGGMAICLIISHAVADATSIATFINTWAAINRGCAVNAGAGFISDCSGVFPPVINTSVIERLARLSMEKTEEMQEKYEMQRFLFSSTSVAQLREKLRLDNDQRTTRTEALTALVWAAVIRATEKCDPEMIKVHELSSMVNLRNRMVPPLPANCIGNYVMSGTTVEYEGTGGSIINYHSLVKNIRYSQRAVDHEFMTKKFGQIRAALLGGGGGGGGGGNERIKKDSFHLYASSVLGVRYYNADFGWGKPRYVLPAALRKGSSLLFIDTTNGGVEAWLGLPKEVMNILLQDHNFLGFVSTFPKSKL